jgi:hypothetical protein
MASRSVHPDPQVPPLVSAVEVTVKVAAMAGSGDQRAAMSAPLSTASASARRLSLAATPNLQRAGGDDVSVLLSRATLAKGDHVDVRAEDGRVGEIGPAGTLTDGEVVDVDGYVLLPAPVEPHAHLDKALSARHFEVEAGNLDIAIEAWNAYRLTLGARADAGAAGGPVGGDR